MKINLRWMVQALAFIGCIYFFLQIWEGSKQLITQFSAIQLITLSLYAVLFLICFFLMAVTSYLKQKLNGTLKNPIPFFEKLLASFRLT